MKPDATKPNDFRMVLEKIFKNGEERSNYLVNFSEKNKFIYVETPKVACTTVKKVLQKAEVDGDTSMLDRDVHKRDASPLVRVSRNLEGFQRVLSAPDTFIFCFVRNPFTRALSCYLDKFVQNSWERNRLSPQLGFNGETVPSFLAFLEAVDAQPEMKRDIHWSAQTFLLRPNRLKYSFIGRFEFFHTHFEQVCRHLGIMEHADFSATWHATGANEKRSEYFGPREVELIHRIYENDFRNFGYGWSPEVI